MLRYILATTLFGITLCTHSQSYVDSPFYKPSAAPPTSAWMGWQRGSIKANGVVIDLYEWAPESAPGLEEIRGWSVAQRVDGTEPAQMLHFSIQFKNVNVTFGYDMLAEPVRGTDRIKCTFSPLAGPADHESGPDKGVEPVALSANLTPLVIKSGDTISITILPLGQDKVAVTEYLQLTLASLAPAAAH